MHKMDKINKSEEEIYDITKYTDFELYDILDLNSPTDRELEAKIIFLIRKYANIQNRDGDRLAKFFKNIYKHFFDIEDDDEEDEDENNEEIVVEGMDTMNTLAPIPSLSGFSEDPNSIVNNGNQILTAAPNSKIQQMQNTFLSVKNNPNMNPLKKYVEPNKNQITTSNEDQVTYTKSLGYTKNQMNPLLSQTIKRIITVDSQYRDNKQTLSTNFTFNLSEQLKDVVSIKLYSVQIPYTWYTINNAFGSNFFYLKGISPGINTITNSGKYDYSFNILSGNYSPTDLVNAINTSVINVSQTYIDISFATTKLLYNSATSLCSMNIDLTKRFNETAYYLSFNNNNWYSPDSLANLRVKSIPSFLGFDTSYSYPNNKYYPFKIKSNTFNYNTTIENSNISQRSCYIDASNNYFTVYQYTIDTTNISKTFDLTTSKIDFSFNINLSLPIKNIYTVNNIISDLSNQIANNYYLNTNYSYVKRIDTSGNNSVYVNDTLYNGQSYYELSLKIDRNKIYTSSNLKTAIVFPSETYNNNPLWISSISCFKFNSRIIDMNNIISDTSPLYQEELVYPITSTPYIKLHCIKTGFDCSINDYYIYVSNSPGYSITEYIDAINSGISDTNKTQSLNSNGDFYLSYTNAFIDSNPDYFKINFDMNRSIKQTYLTIDFTNTYLKENLNFSSIYDLSTNNIIISGNIISTTYFIPSNTLLARIYPSIKNKYMTNDLSYSIYTSASTNLNYFDLAPYLKNQFQNFQDPYDKTYPFNNTICSIIPNGSTFNIQLNINYNKVLTQDDYSIQFFDTSYVNQTNFVMDLSGYVTDLSGYITNTSGYITNVSWNNPYSTYRINFLNGYNLSDSSFNLSNKSTVIFSFDLCNNYIFDSSYLFFFSNNTSNNYYPIYTPTQQSYISNSDSNSDLLTNLRILNTNIQKQLNQYSDFNGTTITLTANTISKRVNCNLIVNISNTLYNTSNYQLYLNGYIDTTKLYSKNITTSIKESYPNNKIGFLNTCFGLSEIYTDLTGTVSTSGISLSSIPIIDTSYILYFGLQNRDSINTNSYSYLIPSPSGDYHSSSDVATNLSNLQRDINNIFNGFPDLTGTSITFRYNNIDETPTVDCSLVIAINQTYNLFNTLSTWKTNLHISDTMISSSYDISNGNLSYHSDTHTTIAADSIMLSNYITIDDTNNTIIITPFEDGVTDPTNFNQISLNLTKGTKYTRDKLLALINNAFTNYQDSYGNNILLNSSIFITTVNGNEQTVIRLLINKNYTAYDYVVVFYDPYSFVKCYVGDKSVSNVTWDSTLGWILGFRNYTSYYLSEYGINGTIINKLAWHQLLK